MDRELVMHPVVLSYLFGLFVRRRNNSHSFAANASEFIFARTEFRKKYSGRRGQLEMTMPIEETSDVVDLSERHHLQCCSGCMGSYIYHGKSTIAEYNPIPLTDSRFVSTNSASILIELRFITTICCSIGFHRPAGSSISGVSYLVNIGSLCSYL